MKQLHSAFFFFFCHTAGGMYVRTSSEARADRIVKPKPHPLKTNSIKLACSVLRQIIAGV